MNSLYVLGGMFYFVIVMIWSHNLALGLVHCINIIFSTRHYHHTNKTEAALSSFSFEVVSSFSKASFGCSCILLRSSTNIHQAFQFTFPSRELASQTLKVYVLQGDAPKPQSRQSSLSILAKNLKESPWI